ncbi:MAG TPA: hypothetical protein VN886_13700, partial [Acidimicrobiales bacterium]|nr:hypothetical protein [Acidimicrobiales bacterium]
MEEVEDRRTAGTSGRRSLPDFAVVFYLGATALLAAYAVTFFTPHTGHIWSLIDNQVVDAFEIVLALGCLARARTRRPRRS